MRKLVILLLLTSCSSDFDFDERPKTDLRIYDTILHIDTINRTFTDTLSISDTIYFNQTIKVYDTVKIEEITKIYDTIFKEQIVKVYDTTKVDQVTKVYDTIRVENIVDIKNVINVYDTITREEIVKVYDTITRKIYVRYYATSEIQQRSGWFNVELTDKEHIKFYDDSGTIMNIQEIILELKE